jgi:thiamine biosynthesis lipoprotein
LRLCKEISGETGGAFDVTVGLLMKCWLNEDKSARDPSAAELKWAEQRTGMAFIQLDESRYAVRLTASPMLVDLGAFGKGYTVDKMVELLREWDIETVLVHAGFSSVYAAGFLSPAGGWPVSISDPEESKRVLAKILLRDESLSGSGLQKGHHIIDPRSGKPVTGKRATWALAGDAATADALSTAFMVMSREEISEYCRLHRGTGGVVLPEPAEVGKAADIFFYGEFPQ